METTTRSQESKCIGHGPCPKCGSRDNLALYSDGHKWCFGCGYYKPSTIRLGDIRKPMDSPLGQRIVSYPNDTTTTLPSVAWQWLKQYGITNEETAKLGCSYSESTGLLFFPQNTGYVARRLTGDGTKYVIQGEKNTFDTIYGTGNTLVFTEDLISAVKVGRVTAALPLFGTHLRKIPEGYTDYRLWLDKDKQVSSVLQCRKWRQYGYNISPIITELDPKIYNETQIKEYLK